MCAVQRSDISFYVMIMVIVYDGSDDGDDARCCCTAYHTECICMGNVLLRIEYNTP